MEKTKPEYLSLSKINFDLCDIKEKSIAQKIKDICIDKDLEEYTRESYESLAEYFQELGDIYLQKKAYIKATALYNFVFTIQRDKLKTNAQETEEKILTTINQFLNQILGDEAIQLMPDDHLTEIKNYKERLQVIRNNVRSSLNETFKNLSEKPDADQAQKSQVTREIFQAIAEKIKDLINIMLDDCYQMLGKPPCQYAIIGLGSLAREEMTPYSDFEWAILIEEGKDTETVKQYFRNLTDLLHLKVINLGETIIPAMAIESLNPAYDKKDWEFFDDITPRGFAFDGLMPQACKIPHGKINEKGEKVFELIQTPKKMATYHGRHPQGGYWVDKETTLTTTLFNWTFIDGNIELIADYAKEVTNILNQPHSGNQLLRHYIFQQLIKKNKNSFYPSLNKLSDEGHLFDAKKDLYRIPNLAIDGLALYFGLESLNSSWEKLEELSNHKKLKESVLKFEAAERLKWVLSETMCFRLQTYLHYNKQQEQMNPLLKYFNLGDENLIAKQFALHLTELQRITLIYQTLMPLHEAMQALANNNLSILKENYLYDTKPYTLGRIATRLCQYEKAKFYFLQALEFDKGKSINEEIIIYDHLASVCIALGDMKQGLENYQKESDIAIKLYGKCHPSVATILNNVGDVYRIIGNAKEALIYHKKALSISEEFYGNQHADVAISLSNVGITFKDLGNLNKALAYLNRASAILQGFDGNQIPYVATILHNIGEAYRDLGDAKQALEYIKKALAIEQKMYGDGHPTVAISLGNIGKAYCDLNEIKQGLDHFKKALYILRRLYGDNHPDVATSFNDVGTAYCDLGKLQLGLKCLTRALAIIKKIYVAPHPDVAASLSNIGEVYYKLGDVKRALEHQQKSLTILQKLYDDQHPKVIMVAENLIKLAITNCCPIQFVSKQPNLTKQSLEKAIAVIQKLNKSHLVTGLTYIYIGEIYFNINKKFALENFKKAISVFEKNYSNHPSLAECYFRIGMLHFDISLDKGIPKEMKKAITAFNNALELYDTSHTDYSKIKKMKEQAEQCLNKNSYPKELIRTSVLSNFTFFRFDSDSKESYKLGSFSTYKRGINFKK